MILTKSTVPVYSQQLGYLASLRPAPFNSDATSLHRGFLSFFTVTANTSKSTIGLILILILILLLYPDPNPLVLS